MEKINLKSIEPLKEGSSRFVVPYRMTYEQNGVEKVWDMVQSHDSVGAIIYNASSKKLVFVSQFRPPVYRQALLRAKNKEDVGGSDGVCLELCMGIVDDKSLSLEETIKKEILEETGFSVKSVEKIGTWIGSVGLSGSNTTTFYARVTEEDRLGPGGGRSDEGEMINVVELSLGQVKNLIEASNKVLFISAPTNLILAYYWFVANKFPLEQ